MATWYPEICCLALIVSLMLGLMLWNKIGIHFLKNFNARNRK